jgi:hypothetical protein
MSCPVKIASPKKTYNNLCVIKITAKQLEVGPLVWGQLFDNITPNIALSKVFIVERLTPENLTILNAARHLRDDGALKYIWQKNGNLLCKEKPKESVQ